MILVTDPATLHVMQGHVRLSTSPNDVLVALLGSCVAACFRDPVLQVGGMNHFLLPGADPSNSTNVRYGAQSMEELVNALLRAGAERSRLEVWLYGGADLLRNKTGVGAGNVQFAKEFVQSEGFRLRGTDLGGREGRRLRFHPYSGTTELVYIDNAPEEIPPKPRPATVELF